MRAVYVHTKKNVLFQVHTQVRLPRTFRRFSGLMTQLLQKLSIRATNGSDRVRLHGVHGRGRASVVDLVLFAA